MVTFFLSLAALICGYVFYSGLVENVMHVDASRPTPAIVHKDGIDYVPMPWCHLFLLSYLQSYHFSRKMRTEDKIVVFM